MTYCASQLKNHGVEMTEEIHLRTCHLCESMCGLEIAVEENRVLRVRPDKEDVWSKGYVCPKGMTLGDLHHDPDRLRAPVARNDEGEFEEVSWDEAFRIVSEKIKGVISEYGSSAINTYIGNPAAHNFSLQRYVAAFMPMSGLEKVWSPGTVDQWPKNVSSALMLGDPWRFPAPDVDRCDYLMVVGANPHASQGSLLAASDLMGRFDTILEKGGRIVVIDPRRTGTCNHASEWLPIRPGTDAALMMAMCHVIFEEGLDDLGEIAGKVSGLEIVQDLVSSWTPERVAETCGIPADRIRSLSRELAGADRGAVYARIGTCNQEFGTLASWLTDVLNTITGNMDREGGAMFGKPIAWSLLNLPDPQYADGFTFGRWKSRVRGAPEVLGQVPVSCLAEEIATPGEGQIKGLIVIAGNPVISSPGADKLETALPELDFLVAVDLYINETTRHADVIFPALSPLEQPHYDELIWNWAVRSAGNFSPAIFEIEDSVYPEWKILLMLAALCQGADPTEVNVQQLDDLFFAGLVGGLTQMPGFALEGRSPEEIVRMSNFEGPMRMLDFQIRTGPWGDAYGANPEGITLDDLKKSPHGIDFGPMVPLLDEVLRTPSGKLELAPEYITADLGRLSDRIDRAETGLVLISRRDLRSNNSWMHNLSKLVSGRNRCTLLMHPEDAEQCSIIDGELAQVRSRVGCVEVPVEVTDEMMPGVVCLPHGWGHDRPGARLRVAAENAGVNNNHLAPGDFVDEISGNQAVNGIPVEVSNI